jgi:pimeloyl-ACP methyl ester carboxylesterase
VGQGVFGWPGLGDQPHDLKINSIDNLVRLVEVKIVGPVDLVAQSMGGVIAARTALNRSTAVRRLVLAVTSAGVYMAQFGASDWRVGYRNFHKPPTGSCSRAHQQNFLSSLSRYRRF